MQTISKMTNQAPLCASMMLADLISADQQQQVGFQFQLQPIYDLRSQTLHGYEALVRLPALQVRPADWRRIDYTMLGLLARDSLKIKLFINLSNETIANAPEELIFAAAKKNDIVFEWSELVMSSAEFNKVAHRLNRWIDRGVRIAIDDYGMGLDGLWRLSALRYKATIIKLDGSMLRLMDGSSFAVTALTGLISACKEHDIVVVSECIETESDYTRAVTMGIDLAQGFFIDGGPG